MTEQKILEILQRYPCSGFTLHHKCMEPGYTSEKGRPVAVGNWNISPTIRRLYPDPLPFWLSVKDADATYKCDDHSMERIQDILKRLGIETYRKSRWTACSICSGIVSTEPTHTGWTPNYWMNGDSLVCHSCVKADPSNYLSSIEGSADTMEVLDIDLEKYGYFEAGNLFDDDLNEHERTGLDAMEKKLIASGIKRFIFVIVSISRFNATLSLWVHESEIEGPDWHEITNTENTRKA